VIPGGSIERLAMARASQARDEIVQRDKAGQTVDGHAIDSQDRAMLRAMLGLDAAQPADTSAPPYLGRIN
jgi:hypothetical protein